MRNLVLAALLVPLPAMAQAWSFAPQPICTLDQTGDDSTVQITFDPDTGIYAIHLTRATDWPDAPVFAITFDGPAPLTISTDRHSIAGPVLTVTDRGFGNVLDGIARNQIATATLGDVQLRFDLTGAAGPVAQFRACPATPLA